MWQNNYEEDYDDYNDHDYDDDICNDNENIDYENEYDDDDDCENDNDDHYYNINDSGNEEYSNECDDDDSDNDENEVEKYPNECDDDDDSDNDENGVEEYSNECDDDDSDNDENEVEEYSNDCDDDDNDDINEIEEYPNECDDDDDLDNDENEEYANECDDDDDSDNDENEVEEYSNDCDDDNDDENEVEEYSNECDDDDSDNDENEVEEYTNDCNDNDDDSDNDENEVEEYSNECDDDEDDDDDNDNCFDSDNETDDDDDDNDENYDNEDINYCYGQNYHKYTQHKSSISRNQKKKELPEPVLRLLEMIFEEKFNGNQAVAYAKYKTLNTSIKLLSTNDEDYQIICQYVTNGHGPTHKFKISIEHIFEIRRSGEFGEFQKNRNRHRRLLWHGTKSKNLVSILQNGLKTEAPPGTSETGKMFGKGIYFADVCTKSAQYCKVDRNDPYGIMILADVALGKQYYLTKAQDVKELRNGKHSVKGLGKYKPDFSKSVKHKYGAFVPNGPLEHKTDVNTILEYSEYVVYKHDRIMLEYLVLVKFQY